ncbi:MAG: hypothetical protein V1776_00330 [Candidatus Diapherotrites archaeon]
MKHLLFFSFVGFLFLSGCISAKYESRDTSSIAPTSISSFQLLPNATICTEDGKPIIRLFSTTTCPHCHWINSTINGVMDEYVAEGKIVAYHWELDNGDNQLTPNRESSILPGEVELFQSVNPQQTVPTYLFGCKYYRVGNAYESIDNTDLEAGEFKAVIEKLISEVSANST